MTIPRVQQHRVVCAPGGVKAERLPWAVRDARGTTQLGALVGELCQVLTNSAVALLLWLHPGTVKTLDKRALLATVHAAHPVSERRATRLLGFGRSTVRCRPHRDPQEALRIRLRELAASRVRFGYRRLTVLLRREGWPVNAKRIYRLYPEEGLIVRTKPRHRAAQRQRVPQSPVRTPNQRWAMDCVHQRLVDGRWFRVLTVLDQCPRECLRLVADSGLSGQKVAAALEPGVQYRGAPQAITVDNGSEFASRALEVWAYQHGIQLDFIRPGRPVENSFIEAFNGRLRDECLNVECFFSLDDARRKLECWRDDSDHYRPHSALAGRTPAEVAATWSSRTPELLEAGPPGQDSSMLVETLT